MIRYAPRKDAPRKKAARERKIQCLWWVVLLWVVGWQAATAQAASSREIDAKTTRLALLVGNQEGWKEDPRLRYVISGDLRPLAARLRQIGFHVLTLENQDASALRAAFHRVQHLAKQHKQLETFLFYYSGHADHHALHLGAKRTDPFTHNEFSRAFGKLPITRRIAIFDACYSGEVIRKFGDLHRYRAFLRVARSKGIRRRRMIDLQPLMTPQKGHERGIRILASSLDLSWEVQRYRASTFTHHLLQGLEGKADLNHDGKITLDELFDYTSQRVTQETGQTPQQLVLLEREEPYAIAPAYRARLRIGAEVIGHLKVAVSGFVWVKQKKDRQALRLAVVDGEGSVFLKRQGQCFQQKILVPKGQEVTLGKAWKPLPCQQDIRRRKGILELPALPYLEPDEDAGFSIALAGSLTGYSLESFHLFQGGAALHLRFFDRFGVGLWMSHGQPEGKSFALTHLLLRPEIGLPYQAAWMDHRIKLFFGLHALLGVTFQHSNEATAFIHAFTAGGGAHFDISWWFSRHVGLRLGLDFQIRYTTILQGSPLTLQGGLHLALLFGR